MRRILLLSFLFLYLQSGPAQNDYFFPEGVQFDADIPSPEEFLGFPIGSFHTRIDLMSAYMKSLAEASDKAHYQIIGYTYEMRPQVILTITSPENHARLEEIRTNHLNSANPEMTQGDFETMPVIVQLGYNVHGNEPSSTEASMLIAYYLVAAENPEISEYLDRAVIIVEPALNPDGRDRHSSWANHHKSIELVADPADREHNEGWPSGRTNHYWFDLNRDWLPLAHIESQNRVEFYHKWLPNVVTDYHEMGTNSTYFFEPTKPFGSENPIVPRSNYDGLNNLFARYFSRSLDEIGSLYWTKEVFDNSYPGYGSTYPDIHGGLGLVFEQASSRGHLQKTPTGEMTFAFTIRNHLRTSIATLQAAVENRTTLHEHQRKFFSDAMKDGAESPVKAYVFGDGNDPGRTHKFLELLLRHNIDCYELSEEVHFEDQLFIPGQSFAVPSEQSQYLMVRTVFENVKSFADSVFYDASAWSMALAYGMPVAEVKSSDFQLGSKVIAPGRVRAQVMIPEASYAYLMSWNDYYAPKALYHLLKNGVNAKMAFKSFETSTNQGPRKFGPGSIMIPVGSQDISYDKLNQLINEASDLSELEILTVSTGLNVDGIDLGSQYFDLVPEPKVLMVIGDGVSAYEAGEVWHLLDTRVGIPATKVDMGDFNRVNLHDYTVLILVSGNYGSIDKEKIKTWVQSGGTLIAQRTASTWAIRNELTNEDLIWQEEKKEKDETEDKTQAARIDFIQARDHLGAKAIGGSFYEIDLDNTNPIGFGYTSRKLVVYRNSSVFLNPSKNPFSTVGQYTDDPWVSGYIHAENLEKIKNSAAILTLDQGRGRVILFSDNPNFRGMMYGTNKLFLNAIFFGPLIDVPNSQ